MIDKDYCISMLRAKDLERLCKYLENEYVDLINKLLEFKGLDIENKSISKKILLAAKNYPDQKDRLMYISEVMLDLKNKNYEKIEVLIDFYKPIYKTYKELRKD